MSPVSWQSWFSLILITPKSALLHCFFPPSFFLLFSSPSLKASVFPHNALPQKEVVYLTLHNIEHNIKQICPGISCTPGKGSTRRFLIRQEKAEIGLDTVWISSSTCLGWVDVRCMCWRFMLEVCVAILQIRMESDRKKHLAYSQIWRQVDWGAEGDWKTPEVDDRLSSGISLPQLWVLNMDKK